MLMLWIALILRHTCPQASHTTPGGNLLHATLLLSMPCSWSSFAWRASWCVSVTMLANAVTDKAVAVGAANILTQFPSQHAA